jgi:phosphate-selective porin OprO/OprP
MNSIRNPRSALLAATALGLWLVTAAAPAAAQDQAVRTAPNDPRDAEINELRTEVRDLAAQVADLKASTADNVRAIRQDEAAAPRVNFDGARPVFSSADGQIKIALRTVVQFDAANDHVSPLTASNDIGSGTNFRRARIGFDGTAYKDWNFALWAELGGSGGESPVLNQAWVEYAGFKPIEGAGPLRIRAGAWAAPAGLEDATPNTEGLFLERADIAEMVRGLDAGDGRTGVGVSENGAHWFAEAVLTGKTVGVPASTYYGQQAGYLVRVGLDPIHGPDYDVHLGASVQGVLRPADTAAGPAVTEVIRFSQQPELRVASTVPVDTGSLNAKNLTIYGAEAGASWRNFYASGEYFQLDLNRRAVTGSPSPFDPSFSGWYVQGAWTLTGERHEWTPASGGFRGIRPAEAFDLGKGTWGAWEFAARYSSLDLNDHSGASGAATPVGGVRGGKQDITTIGLNWYPNSLLRFLLDYQWTDVTRLGATGLNLGEHVNAVSFRSQFAF